VVLTGCVFAVASIMAMQAVGGDLKDNLQCILDNLRALLNPSNTRMTAGADAGNVIPNVNSVLDSFQRGLDQIGTLAVAPGALAMAFIFLTALTSFAGRMGNSCFMLSKLLVLFTIIVILLNFVFFGALAGLGVISGLDQFKINWASVTSTCTDSNLAIESQLLTAQTSLAQAQAYGQSTVQEQADVDAAQLQNQQFGAMCVCMTATLSKLEPLTTPGAIGLFACFLAIITVDGLCCAMGCCNGKRVAPGKNTLTNTKQGQAQNVVAV